MSPGNDRRRPLAKDAANVDEPRTDLNLTRSVAPCEDSRDELARVVDGTIVVVVKATGGRYRRRAFLTAAAAEKAADKAIAAGHNATVYLAQLKPLFRLTGGGQ